ncbi:hypothetical protein CPJ18_25360 (plasmid) [Agrobacterium rosae]|uniref:Flagellin N-terminal domain-containing protein n=1 Tax=Agrobacterium rosae TaxID=1972867 RepID=A0AAE5RSX9_9HYPH|nr:hypothetical protein CPJ18_25360 [Agrobacterium rosae]
MTSILTNTSAATALQTLRTVSGALEKTRAETSSGFRVEAASDGVAYRSIATTMRSDSKALSAVHDAFGLTAANVDVAYTGMEGAVDLVSEFKAALVLAKEPSVDREKIDARLAGASAVFQPDAALSTNANRTGTRNRPASASGDA